MTRPHMPSAEHAQFDAICAPVDDFETLPTVAVQAPTSRARGNRIGWQAEEFEAESEVFETAADESLDGLILAGLVAPY